MYNEPGVSASKCGYLISWGAIRDKWAGIILIQQDNVNLFVAVGSDKLYVHFGRWGHYTVSQLDYGL